MSVTELPDRHSEQPADYGRTPPQDVEAEQAVLGGMLLSKDAIADVVEVVRGHDFYRPAHEVIYEAILDLYGRGEPADALTVASDLQKQGELGRIGGAPYLHTLVSSVPSAANAGYYANIVRQHAILRRLIEAGTRVVQMGYGGDGDADDIVDRAQAEVYAVTDRRASEDYLPLGDIMEGALDEIEAIGSRDGEMVGVPTGFADLDTLTNGLHPGQMIILAARPAIGKSTLGLDIARASSIKHNLTSVIFSLEMSRNEITMRLLSAEAKVPLHHMRAGQMTDDDWNRIARCTGEVSNAPLFVDDSPNMTMMEIRAKCRRLKQRHNLRLVIVDYLQLMTSGKKVESRQQEVSEFSRSLKLLAKEIDVPVVAIAQLNRGPEQRTDKKPMLSDLRESGCLTEDTALIRADTGTPVTFSDLMENGYQGVVVWSLDEQLRLVPAPLTNVFASGVKDVFRLRLRSGREVKATGNHKFLTLRGWKPLSELNVEDRVAIPGCMPEPIGAGLGWSNERLGLLGHLIGDGCVVRKQPVHYTSEDDENLMFVEGAATSEFEISPRRVAQGNWQHVYLPNPVRSARGRRNPLHQWFAELGIENLRSHEKRIPDVLYSASRAELAVFLRHLWATDGRVAEPSGMKSGIPIVSYSTTSRVLADGVMTLLARFGIIARLTVVAEKNLPRPGYRLLIQSGPSIRTFCREIGVHGARGRRAESILRELDGQAINTNVDTVPREVWEIVKAERRRRGMSERQFQASIDSHYWGSALYKSNPSRERLLRCAEALDSETLRTIASNDVFWDEVAAIEPLGSQAVYDATVKGTHNFIADGVIAHNSLEQDADAVILLHREDAYEKESPRAGEADFIVAKHRNGPTATITVAFQGHYSRFVDMAQ